MFIVFLYRRPQIISNSKPVKDFNQVSVRCPRLVEGNLTQYRVRKFEHYAFERHLKTTALETSTKLDEFLFGLTRFSFCFS